MKNLRANLIRITVPLILLIAWSCSNGKLSNAKAENTIKQEYPRYIITSIQIRDVSLWPLIQEEIKLLSNRDLARYTYIPPGTRGYGFYGELTEKGAKYLVNRRGDYIDIAVAKVEIGSITGIREDPANNSSEVEYTEKIVEITPVGEIYRDLKVGKTYDVKAIFIKYNDGWRLDELSTTTDKISISGTEASVN